MEVVDPPNNKIPISMKWVFKTKLKPNDNIAKQNTRFVGGFLQKIEVDYIEVYCLIARMKTIRLVISIESSMGWPLYQLLRQKKIFCMF